MVSPKINRQLQIAYDNVRNQTIDIHDYSGKEADVLFEIISAETFIAGIASKLIEHTSLIVEEKLILERTFLDGNIWHLEDGSDYSIVHIPEILNYAKQLEHLRKLCLEVTRNN